MRKTKSYIKNSISFLVKYFAILSVSFHDSQSLFGFCILLTVFSQLFTGTMLSFSLIPEPMLIPIMRDEEDLEDLYTDDFFWLHERGVDLLFIFSWFHLLRKLYVGAYEYEHEIAWKSGVYTFLVLQVVTFFGLVLCCTHLSEITLTIAANILHTFFMFHGKFYWIIFTDKSLNSDTVVRLAFAHYLSAFFMAYMGVLHSFDMHYDWKTEHFENSLENEILWWDEALSNELGFFLEFLVFLGIFGIIVYPEPETLSYELFMWGDIGMMTDIRFYGVAPHWYFRPFMAWLIVCPHHKTGIFGLIFFFFILFHQPTLHGNNEHNNYYRRKLIINNNMSKVRKYFKQNNTTNDNSFYFQFFYLMFFLSCLYCSSFLPYGRFYNRLGGNLGMLFSYFYLFCYLTFPIFRKNIFFYMFLSYVENKASFLKKGGRINTSIKDMKNYNMSFFYRKKKI